LSGLFETAQRALDRFSWSYAYFHTFKHPLITRPDLGTQN
jgi:hypothetical protein